jgi:hypothetical protein
MCKGVVMDPSPQSDDVAVAIGPALEVVAYAFMTL